MSGQAVTQKWTNGPWKVQTWRVVDSRGEGGIATTVICDTANNAKTRTDENQANALLISKAPEMYEMLRIALTLPGPRSIAEEVWRKRVESLLASLERGI